MQFTDEQKDAIFNIEGNLVCLASAGSGKTSSFVTRIAYMIKQKKIKPHSILAITFTKKATEEMKSRLVKMIGKQRATKVPMGTFHSIAFRLLKSSVSDFSNFRIAPDWWRFSLLNDLCAPATARNPNGQDLPILGVELGSLISYFKNSMIDVGDDFEFNDRIAFAQDVPKEALMEAYRQYEYLKLNSRQIDFDDMLAILYRKLIDDPNVKKTLSEMYEYIMVDEFQDTPLIVKEIIKMINNRNVFVVGDFRQSIYGFINASVDNILDFKDEFPNTKVVQLNKNFRSTQKIVNLSNEIIEHSPIEKYKQFSPSVSVAEEGDDIHFSYYYDEYNQIERIVNQIKEDQLDEKELKEIAILVRTNAQTALLETQLTDAEIPFDVSKSTSFFDRKEIVDLLSYAQLGLDKNDDVAMRRVYNTPNRYLSKQFIHDAEVVASEKSMSLTSAIKKSPYNSKGNYRESINKLMDTVDDIGYQVKSDVNAGRLLQNIVKMTRYLDYLEKSTANPQQLNERKESIEKLCSVASKFPNINAFLVYVSKVKDNQKKPKDDAVQIITMHSSKGLEWNKCYVINCNEKNIPHEYNLDIEEERRLFYVACSRPRKELYVSWIMYDSELKKLKPSRFVSELIGLPQVKLMNKGIVTGRSRAEHFDYNPNT